MIVIDHSESNSITNMESKCTTNEETRTHYFIRKLLATADQNVTRAKNGFRLDEDIKLFATYVRMLAGPKLYNFLHKNLQLAIPALSSVNRYVYTSNCRIIEGVLRREELLLYLKQRDLEPLVSLSEDATRIVDRIQYDIKTNQIVGFALPTACIQWNANTVCLSDSDPRYNSVMRKLSSLGNTSNLF